MLSVLLEVYLIEPVLSHLELHLVDSLVLRVVLLKPLVFKDKTGL
jgi:hypothetical protein